MASLLRTVQPGDLITAAFMNDLLSQLQGFDKRISDLEAIVPGSGGSLAIQGLQWPSSDLHMGDELRISGVNLGLQGETTVNFGGLASVTVFKPGSGDKLLIVEVPPMAITGSSKTMILTVANPRTGSDSRTITVFQGLPITPDGTLTIASPVFPAGNINPGDVVVTFPFTINTLNMEETFKVVTAASLTGQQPQTLVTAALNDLDQVISTLTLPKTDSSSASTHTIKVRITIPQGSGGAAAVSLALVSQHNTQLGFSSGTVPFTIGQPAPPQAKFPLERSAGPQSPGTFDPATATFTLPVSGAPAAGYKVKFRADMTDMPGSEQYTITASSGSPLWSVTAPAGFSLGSSPGQQLFDVVIKPSPNAPKDNLSVIVQGAEASHRSEKVFTIAIQP